jgi:integrase
MSLTIQVPVIFTHLCAVLLRRDHGRDAFGRGGLKQSVRVIGRPLPPAGPGAEGDRAFGRRARPLFQPQTNCRTLGFDEALSTRVAQKVVKRWAEYSRLGGLSPHDLRRAAVTRAPESGLTYRQVQMMSKHRDPKAVMRYDRGGRIWSCQPSTSSTTTNRSFHSFYICCILL